MTNKINKLFFFAPFFLCAVNEFDELCDSIQIPESLLRVDDILPIVERTIQSVAPVELFLGFVFSNAYVKNDDDAVCFFDILKKHFNHENDTQQQFVEHLQSLGLDDACCAVPKDIIPADDAIKRFIAFNVSITLELHQKLPKIDVTEKYYEYIRYVLTFIIVVLLV